MTEIIFYILSILAIFSSLMVVFSRNPIHSILYLILTFFAIAGHYILLNAQFLAIVHIIVYAGAIMVLFLFVIMLLNLNAETEPHKSNLLKFAAVIAGGLVLLVLVASIRGADQALGGVASLSAPAASNPDVGLVKNLGKVLFTKYVFPFEISSILFLAAMVGAILLGKKETH